MNKKIRSQMLILGVLILIMFVTFSYRFFYRSIGREQYQNIHIGMSAEEVKKLLGEPVKITKYSCLTHGNIEVWRYNTKYSLLVVSIRFKINKKNKKHVWEKNWGF